MVIPGIRNGNGGAIELRHLRVFEVLLRELSLTRAAQVLDVTQPAISKALAQLRLHFSDPLFVRVGNGMAPTSKALELEASVRSLLDQVTMLYAHPAPFDPCSSTRMFRISAFDAAVIRVLPPLVTLLHQQAPSVKLVIVPIGHDDIEAALEIGELDFALGSYVSLTKRVRRQLLFSTAYVSVTRKHHPRLKVNPTLKEFAAEKHVLVTASGTGHAHKRTERAIEKTVPPENITCRVPTFLAAVTLASMTDTIATLPAEVAEPLLHRMELRLVSPPMKLPKIDVLLYWHQRFHRSPANEWLRAKLISLFRHAAAS